MSRLALASTILLAAMGCKVFNPPANKNTSGTVGQPVPFNAREVPQPVAPAPKSSVYEVPQPVAPAPTSAVHEVPQPVAPTPLPPAPVLPSASGPSLPFAAESKTEYRWQPVGTKIELGQPQP